MTFREIRRFEQPQHEQCAICTRQMDSDDNLLAHAEECIFHAGCIEACLGIYDKCPICQIEISHINGIPVDQFRKNVNIDLEEAKKRSFITAAIQGDSPKVQKLISQGIDDELAEKALIEAVKNGDATGAYSDVVRILLLNREISAKTLKTAINVAAGLENTLILQYLLASGDIEENALGEAVIEAVKNGYLENVQILLNHSDISDDDRGSALIWGIENYPIMEALLNSGNVGEADASMALLSAQEKNDLNAVKLLLEKGIVSQESRDRTFIESVKDDHLQIARAIYFSGAISPWAWNQAAAEAANLGYDNLYNMLNTPIRHR